MQPNNFTIHFVNQFHLERIVYPGKKEQQYENVMFRKFAGGKKETPVLAASVEGKLHDSAIVGRLVANLENENLPDYFRISSVAHNLKRQVSSYIKMGPFTTNYYKKVLSLLDPFISLIDDFQEKSQQILLNNLKALQTITTNKANNTAYSGEIEDLVIVMERFIDQMYDYYNDFNCCVNKESEGLKGVTVTTYMEQYMIKLVSLIEKIMYDTRSTQTLLQSWKVVLAKRELQMIYN